jgi:hypothetical protein
MAEVIAQVDVNRIEGTQPLHKVPGNRIPVGDAPEIVTENLRYGLDVCQAADFLQGDIEGIAVRRAR